MAITTEMGQSDRGRAGDKALRLPKAPGEQHLAKISPANENNPGAALMLARLRRRPSFKPYGLIATVVTALWSGGWFFDFVSSLGAAAPVDGKLQALALLIVPVIVWPAAYMLWRAADMRQVSEAMFQSAMRLVHPQDVATEGLTTIAQAVRCEVDLLVGGVEDAVQRAVVLEEIVHKEIAALERVFGGNEERIRSLVSGIENQRSALQAATLLISVDTNPLINQLENGTRKLDTIMASAQDTLDRLEGGLHTMDDFSQRAHATISEIGVQTTHMEDVSSRMLGQIRDFARQLAGQIDQMRQASAALSTETVDFSRSVEDMEANIVHSVRHAVDTLMAVNQEITRTIERSGVSSADQIRQQVNELAEIVQHTASNLTFQLKTVSEDVATQLKRASMDTAQHMEQRSTLISEGMQSMAGELIERVSQSHSELIGFLDQTSAGLSAAIDEAADNVTVRLNEAGTQFLTNLDQTTSELLSEHGSTSTGMSDRT